MFVHIKYDEIHALIFSEPLARRGRTYYNNAMNEHNMPDKVWSKASIWGRTRRELSEFFIAHGENPAKADLVFRALYRENCRDLARLEQLSPRVRQILQAHFDLELPVVEERLENDKALKLLLRLSDGQRVESVVMKHGFGWSLCLSTQAGCAMGCAFCASGRRGRLRQLLPQEMTGQLLLAREEARRWGQDLRGLALMGVGEPLDNLDNVLAFLDIAGDIRGLDFGPRHITLSTCGLPAGIRRLAQQPRPHNLCLSLHAPTDQLRSQLMPINRVYGLPVVLEAVRYYAQRTRQRVIMEYALLDGVNDSDQCAAQLTSLLQEQPFPCSVNLIPFNPTDSAFRPSPRPRVLRFYDILKQAGLSATIRKEMGSDIKAACGQLRAESK